MDRKMSRVLFGAALAGAIVLAALIVTDPAWAGTFFVDQSHPLASDTNPGTEALPWLTLHRAVDGIPSREQGGIAGTFPPVQAGDTVYVKNGSYVDVQGSSVFITAYLPTNSGTANAPIAFRAYTPPTGPRHTPVLHRSPDSTSEATDFYAVIGSGNRNYIIWDGFVLAPGTTAVTGGDGLTTGIGNVFENLDINFGIRPCTGNNAASIYIIGATDTTVRNNRIRGALVDGSGPGECFGPNARGIYLIDTGRNLIHNNEISDAGVGIGIKRVGWDNIFERNYIHDIQNEGISIGATSPGSSECPASPRRCDSSNNVIRQNVLLRAGTGFSNVGPAGAVSDNTRMYNNTMYLVGWGSDGAGTNARYYNNIIHLNMSLAGPLVDITFWSGLPTGFLSNFSMYFDTIGLRGHFNPQRCCLGELTLPQWQAATGQDANSLLANPLFVGALTGTPPPSAFRLQSFSPARSAGRVGGVSAGAPVNMGAYISDSDVIGTGNSDVIPPSPPTNLSVVQ